jgi:phosphomethylpyrimidine synthase
MNSKTPVQPATRNFITREPLPASRKIYLSPEGHPDVRVPVREIGLTDGTAMTVYDTSGPYTDPDVDIDVHKGLPDLRGTWIEARGDTEFYEGREITPIDNGHEEQDKAFKFYNEALQRQPRRAKAGGNVTQIHYARQGIITPEMEYIALRENQPATLWAPTCSPLPQNSSEKKWPRAGPSFPPISTTRSWSR